MKQVHRVAHAIVAITAVIGLSGEKAGAQQQTIPIEGYAAKVNDRVIMVSEVMSMVRPAEARLRESLDGNALRKALAEAYQDALDALIERELILEEYEDKEGEIPQKVVEDQMSRVLAERFGNDRSRLLTALQQEHLSYDEWRRQIEGQLIISVMRRDAVLDKVSLSPNAARELYETKIEEYRTPAEVKLHMITVGKGTTEEEVLAQATRIKTAHSRIAAGESFATVAEELSEGSRAAYGGDKGWVAVRDLRPELAKVVDQLEVGHLSRIVAAGDSYYLLLVEDRHPEYVVPYADARDELEQELRRSEIERIQVEWTERLREKHFVQTY